jgi:hypothetical protein
LEIIKSKIGKKVSKGGVRPININGNLTNNQQMIVNSFNNYFLTIVNKIIDDNRNDKIGQSNNLNNPLYYMLQIFKHPFPNIKFNYA